MTYKSYLLIALYFCAQSQISAQTVPEESLEEVVVTDSRFELKRENSGKTVIKISQQEIENNQGRTISELINTKSGIEINGSRSNAGQNLGVYVRGGRNRQVLVLIDGIQVNDPSELSGGYDLRLLNLNQIESIEIIKGAASTLYGSGAATAVVNIITKAASTKKISTIFLSSIGTNQTESDQNYNIADFSNSVSLSGTLNKFTYRTAFNNQFSDGLSAAISDTNEKDAYSKYGVDANLGYKFNTAFSINIYGNYTDTKSNIDGYDANFNFVDTADTFNSKQSRVGVSSNFKYNKGSVNLNAAYSEYDRAFVSDFPSQYKSKNFILDVYNKYVFDNTFYTIIGLNVIENEATFTSDETFNILDPYANFVYVSDFGFHLNAGVRLNNHNAYGSHFIYNLNPSFTLKSDKGYTKIFGSYSTSFITPSLSNLFGNFGANPNLNPEENLTIEAGIEWKLNDNFRISGLFFNREEENTVLWIDGGYLNAADVLHARGVEIEFQATLLEKISVETNYTFVEYKEALARRIPKHKANVQLGYQISKSTFGSVSYQYTHQRFENSFVPLLDSFSLFNIYVSHTALHNKLTFFGGLDNILNESYEDILGYATKGRNVKLGFQLNL